ncbi:MAG: DUF1579 family protein [Planctomycetota bacterium]
MNTTKPSTVATLLAGAALGLAAAVPFVATAEPDKDGSISMEQAMQMDPAEIIKMMQEMSEPTEHHKMFDGMVGTYDMTARFWMDPTAEPEISTGTSTSKTILGGRYLVSDVNLDMNFGGMNIPMQGMAIMGYSRPTNEYQTLWIDTFNTNMTMQTGNMTGEELSVVGETATPFGPSKLKNVYITRDNGYDLEFYEPNPMTGEMMKTGVIEYRKAQG